MNVEELREEYPVGTGIEVDIVGENGNPIRCLKGMVSKVDDMGQIHMEWDDKNPLTLNEVRQGFNVVDEKRFIRVIYCEPNKYPRLVDIPDTLAAMKNLVEGPIEEYMPFDDEVAIVCNEEGKINGKELNRAIYGKDGRILDVIAGKFFVCYAPIESENFLSMPKDLQQKYEKLFKYPEHFYRTHKGVEAKPFKPVTKEYER